MFDRAHRVAAARAKEVAAGTKAPPSGRIDAALDTYRQEFETVLLDHVRAMQTQLEQYRGVVSAVRVWEAARRAGNDGQIAEAEAAMQAAVDLLKEGLSV